MNHKSRKSLQPEYDFYIKLLMLGDSGVGKSSLLLRFSENLFHTNLMGTAGIDFKTKYITLEENKLKLEIWDTAGQERFRSISQKYYQGSMGVILVYDVSDMKSFENVDDWISQINSQSAQDNIAKLLVGNKSDLQERTVSYEKGDELGKKYGIPFIETSAKDDKNVKEGFTKVASMVMSNETILLKSNENAKKLNKYDIIEKNSLKKAEELSKLHLIRDEQKSKEKKCC